MVNLLHMSDLHLGMQPELEKKRLNQLGTWLNESGISVNYIIFTGDLIDAQTIRNKCIADLAEKYSVLKDCDPKAPTKTILQTITNLGPDCIKQYDSKLKERTAETIDTACKIFSEFAQQIRVSQEHIILCCGNHDGALYAKQLNRKLICKKSKLDTTKAKPDELFEYYDLICSKLNPSINHKVILYTVDGYTFVIGNTNWGDVPTDERYRCIDCAKLVENLNTLSPDNRDHCIFIAHQPFDDFCEDAKYVYGEAHTSIKEKISSIASVVLFGDKHTAVSELLNNTNIFLCGSQLSRDSVRYNYITLDGDQVSNQYIEFGDNRWGIRTTSQPIQASYDLCKQYIKPLALSFLFEESTPIISWDDVFKHLQDENAKRKLQIISSMFTDSSSYYTHKSKPTSALLDRIIFVLATESKKKQALALKGIAGTGKSTFLSISYLYSMYKLAKGQTISLPFYFDFRYVIEQGKKTKSESITALIERCENAFRSFIESCKQISQQNRINIWVFVSGLEDNLLLSSTIPSIESRAFQILEEQLTGNDRYVMALNTDTIWPYASFENHNTFEQLIWFNEIKVIPYDNDTSRLVDYIKSYLMLSGKPYNDNNVDIIITNLAKLRYVDISLSFLHHCYKVLSDEKNNKEESLVLLSRVNHTIRQIYESQVSQLMTPAYRFVSGQVYSDWLTYQELEIEIHDHYKDFSVYDFLFLFHSPLFYHFLIADCYYEELYKYSNEASKINPKSILLSFIPHDIALSIRILLSNKSAVYILSRFLENHITELSEENFLYSMFVYLCGHLRNRKDQCIGTNLLDKLQHRLQSNMDLLDDSTVPSARARFFSLLNSKSFTLAMSVASEDLYAEQLILKLMDDEQFRDFYRVFQLHYYGDSRMDSANMREEWTVPKHSEQKKCRFDFRRTYLVLATKLKEALATSVDYPLMELDLFTICDLLYAHLANGLQDELIKTGEHYDVAVEQTINNTVFLLEQYLNFYRGSLSANERIGAYFAFMYDTFYEINEQIKADTSEKPTRLPYKKQPLVSIPMEYERICRMTKLLRADWSIMNEGPVSDTTTLSLERDSNLDTNETIAEHTLGCLYIAQMFLPNIMAHEDSYSKAEVMSFILYSEIGKSETGDFTPHFANYYELVRSEQQTTNHYLSLGAVDGFATQTIRATALEPASTDINKVIAYEIKMIQMEYSYFKQYSSLGFSAKRHEEFLKTLKIPSTDIGKKIRKLLILDNPAFDKARGLDEKK